jgi:hypothetical protein
LALFSSGAALGTRRCAIPADLSWLRFADPCGNRRLDPDIAIAFSAAAPTHANTRGWTTPRVHFSFAAITFDLSYGYWRSGAQVEPLADCSNERSYCLSSPTFSIALPKRCLDLEAGHWSVGSVRTEIVFRQVETAPPIHGGGSATTLYLGSAQRPHQLFVYDLSLGLRGLYWDEHPDLDFIAMARAGSLGSWLESRESMAARWQFYFPLTTLGLVAECHRGQ